MNDPYSLLFWLLTGEADLWRWLAGKLRPHLVAPSIPPFSVTRKGTSMQLKFGAFATLPDPSLSYSLTVTPSSGPPIVVAVPAGAPSFVVPNVPAGTGTIRLDVVDASADVLSPDATRPYSVAAAPTIPAFTVEADPAQPDATK